MPDQFGSFDGLDNRKTVCALFVRMGRGLNEQDACMKRAGFLQALLNVCAASNFQAHPVQVTPCTPAEAYHLFIAITGCLNVPIEWAAKVLEDFVKLSEERPMPPGQLQFEHCGPVLARETLRRVR